AHLVGQLGDFLGVTGNGLGQVLKTQRQHLGIGQTQHHAPAQLHGGQYVLEVGILKPHVVLVGVVIGVVDSVLFFAAKAEVERGDADMLQKDREVGTGAEGVEGEL